jgi:hypothetical protein
MRSLLPALAIVFCIASAVPNWSAAEQPAKPGTVPPPSSQQIYRPTISDLMNDLIQPRHTKLWLAGKAGNWTLAEYERHNINGAFGRIATAVPSVKGAQTYDLLSTFIAPSLAALARAINAHDQNAFAAAYATLTEGCNECHQATGYTMVVIQAPTGDPFSDQDFRLGRAPSKK